MRSKIGIPFCIPLAVVSAVTFIVTLAAPAHADVKSQQNVLQIGEITIVGRVQKPIAAVDVAKIEPKLTLAELRQPFLDRVEEVVHKDPF